ncbi:MAG: TIGR02679 family protein [Aeromicrobium sp.]|uniref:TIGR02679 family protein n=1 Tax=Aeromicrobium sp. TaxID=1871063 RepID=UPI0039E46B33
MSSPVLERLLGGSDLAWLRDRVRARIADSDACDGRPLSGVVVLRDPSEAQRTSVARLLGRRSAGARLRVDLAEVEELLRRGPWPSGLADAVVTLTGPVVDHRAVRAREQAEWTAAESLMESWDEAPDVFRRWWRSWCADGQLKRVARAEARRCEEEAGPAVAARLVRQLAEVLAVLPASDVPLAVFARQVVGDAHGLDESRPLGRMAATAAGVAFGVAGASRRDAWAAAGVVLSNVSSTVLVLGLPGNTRADGPVGQATATALEAMRQARSPSLLTLDQVRSGGVAALPADAVVHVCENPTVVEVAAARWSVAEGGAPLLVCTSGQPSTAVVELLAAATSRGAECWYHGDFDWAGLRIARTLHERIPWSPWRYGADGYRAALADQASAVPLVGPPVDTPWDDGLRVAMEASGMAVEEESVADLLADDLVAVEG